MTQISNSEFLVAFVIAASAGTVVWFHADKNGIKHPSAWAIAVWLFLAIGLPCYIVHVRRVRRARAQR
jgi:hypothetical protein